MLNPNEQYAHKETGLWHDVLRKYAQMSNYGRALDIGTAAGLSLFTIIQAGTGKVVSVGDKGQQGASQLAQQYGYVDRIELYQMKSQDFWKVNEDTFDFISIDGSHEYEDVLVDAREAWKVLNQGGYIVFDDFAHHKLGKQVGKAVNEWAGEAKILVTIENGKAIAHKEKKSMDDFFGEVTPTKPRIHKAPGESTCVSCEG